VTPEATVVPELVTRLELTLGPPRWADAALRVARTHGGVDPAVALARVRASDFDLHASARALEGLYRAA
jgi:hypothetical protein